MVHVDVLGVHPFCNDQDVHPAEEGEQEKELGHELTQEVEGAPEVEAVQALHYDTQRHLDDGEDDCQLHLEVVRIPEKLLREEPLVVKPEGVDTVNYLV